MTAWLKFKKKGDVIYEADGLIGMDVFSKFLVTMDYPMRKLLLGPLPPRPGDNATNSENLSISDDDDDDAEMAANQGSTQVAASNTPAPARIKQRYHDRYIAPEMKDYTPVYRVGHDLIIPASLNNSKIKLFILDTGSWTTTISPQAAREVTKVHKDTGTEVIGLNGEVRNVYSANEITFKFANISQKVEDVVAFDTNKISKSVGTEISGLIGAIALDHLVIHIDYRDGLVKLEYDPNRGYNVWDNSVR